MKIIHIAAYSLVSVVMIASYTTTTTYIISPEPPEGIIVISNLTLNYLLTFLVAGAFGTKVPQLISSAAPKWLQLPSALMIGVLLLLVMKFIGLEMKF